jgi:hypothetical protein
MNVKRRTPKMDINKMPKFLAYSNMTLNQILEKVNDDDTTEEELIYLIKALHFVDRKVQDAQEDFYDFKNLNESKVVSFKDILREGGKRRHIPQSIRDKFVHAVLIIPNPEDRQAEIDAIFAEIAEKNTEAYYKEHPELKKEQDSEDLKESIEDDNKLRRFLTEKFENSEHWW